jgi:Glycogen recognition site of AMP-activated protein kinase
MAKAVSIKKKKVNLAFDTTPGKTVLVAGEFNDWEIDEADRHKKLRKMKEEDQPGHYTITMFLPTGKHEYKFFVEGEWHMDPLATEKALNAFGTYNSVLEVN